MIAPLRVRWVSGLGLAVWPDAPAEAGEVFGAVVEVPASLADLLAERRLRHAVDLGGDGTRQYRPATGLGVPSAVELLDRCEHLPVGGDIAFYRYLLAGVRAYISSGAVAPSTCLAGGEYEVRWVAVPTPAWRSWLAVAHASAPPLIAADAAAVTDFVDQALDHECRRRLAAARRSSSVPVIAGLADRAPTLLSADAGPRSLQSWQDWVGTAGPGTAAVVLRLHTPDDDPDEPPLSPAQVRWRLEVCRQTPTGELAPAVPHRLDPHELDAVTTELARATVAFGELSRAEADPHSLDFLLTTGVVDELLGGGVADLQAAGITVLLPSSIAAVTPTLSIRSEQVPGGGSRPGFVGLDEISDFEWRLALGDVAGGHDLTQSDIDELAQQSGDLVRLRGKWLRAEGAALHRAASFIAAQRALASADARPTMAELLALVTDRDGALPVPLSAVSGLGWLDDIADGGVFAPPQLPAPSRLRAQLRPYQQRGLEWLAALGGIGAGGVLADDMGLGKTVQVIALLTANREGSADSPPALVVCPMSVIGNWSRELATFAPHLRVLVHHGSGRSADRIAVDRPDVVLTTFATLSRDRVALAASAWAELVVDEAQHVKNVHTAAAKALRAIGAAQRIALTGTPVENRLEDLRAVIDLVNPGMLGTASSFRARFAEPIERDRDPRAVARLSAVTRPFILRREKTDPAIAPDLPAKTELLVRTNLSSEQAGLYQAVLNELNEALADTRQSGPRRRTVLAALTRLKQICNHPAHYLDDGSAMLRRGRHRSGKVELLVDILTTVIADGERALVFTQFAAFAELLSQWLAPVLGTDVPLLHGGSSREQRDAMVSRFAESDGPPVLLATLKAGGTGLNLVAANHVIHADRWWNPAVEDQATDRAYRIGQQRNVQVRKFVCVGTLEERIDEMITAKRELSALTVSTGESWLTELDDDTLLDLLALRDEAVGE
ncbi:DEAD/DEAH box helicase [Gordonia hydrophobica]|uniref:DEAD/DEAH box helicase n=1 Tax=Gordonia hydrophobica TaxID=40516 RepID=A0ABZ2U2I6_9ACTN|nr:DEAD/DEAH box helicase [Gordonia hydrophobica]MBM7366883.1 superfamily II DNA or RNA helicase [Gordonia hydrophobica]